MEEMDAKQDDGTLSDYKETEKNCEEDILAVVAPGALKRKRAQDSDGDSDEDFGDALDKAGSKAAAAPAKSEVAAAAAVAPAKAAAAAVAPVKSEAAAAAAAAAAPAKSEVAAAVAPDEEWMLRDHPFHIGWRYQFKHDARPEGYFSGNLKTLLYWQHEEDDEEDDWYQCNTFYDPKKYFTDDDISREGYADYFDHPVNGMPHIAVVDGIYLGYLVCEAKIITPELTKTDELVSEEEARWRQSANPKKYVPSYANSLYVLTTVPPPGHPDHRPKYDHPPPGLGDIRFGNNSYPDSNGSDSDSESGASDDPRQISKLIEKERAEVPVAFFLVDLQKEGSMICARTEYPEAHGECEEGYWQRADGSNYPGMVIEQHHVPLLPEASWSKSLDSEELDRHAKEEIRKQCTFSYEGTWVLEHVKKLILAENYQQQNFSSDDEGSCYGTDEEDPSDGSSDDWTGDEEEEVAPTAAAAPTTEEVAK
eukprot:COSAG02_NODE_6043_length_3848_cov_1.920512_6_plen_479_part_00